LTVATFSAIAKAPVGRMWSVVRMLCRPVLYFAFNGKSSAETILLFEPYPSLSTHNTEYLFVEWLVSMPVVQVVLD